MAERGSLAGALQRLAGELLGATTPAVVGALVATTAAELLGADAAAVFARVDRRTLEALHTTGWPDDVTRPFRRLDLQRGRPLSDAVLDRCPVWLEDAAQWRRRYPDMAPVGTASDMQASACLPLSVEDRDLGAVVFSFAAPRRFSAADREFLMAVTALCAQGFDRARLLVAERTARETAERQLGRMTFLSRTTRLMEAPLSVEERLQQLADLAVSEFADWCAVHLVRGNRVDQVAVAHSDPAKVAFVARLQERYPPGPDAPGGAIRVSRTGEPAYYPEVPDELLAAAAVDGEHLALIRSIGMRSALIVPLAGGLGATYTTETVHGDLGIAGVYVDVDKSAQPIRGDIEFDNPIGSGTPLLDVTIETAGTLYLPVECDLMSISPKFATSAPASETHPRWHRRCAELVR
jgi:GAF domain-containing protein